MNTLNMIQRKAKKLNQQQAFAAALIKQQLASKQEVVA